MLLDDGELNDVGVLLFEMDIDVTWLTGSEIRDSLARPGDLLVTNRKRALEVPHRVRDLSEPGGPAWICFHNKDFASLREILRELGAHFLVHTGGGGPDPALLRLLFTQLSHHGTERRQTLRLPCRCGVQVAEGNDRFEGELRDLAADSCRIEVNRDLRVATPISVYFPSELDPAAPTAYRGVVLRTQLLDRDEHRFGVVIGFDEPDVRQQLSTILAGQGIGTRVIQLAPPPKHSTDVIPIDRRELGRRRYARRVACLRSLDDAHPHVVMAHDLSMRGARVDRDASLLDGSAVILALPQGKGVSPLLIDGRVRRDAGADGLGIEFMRLADDKREILQGILSKLSPLDAPANELGEDDLTPLSEFELRRGGSR